VGSQALLFYPLTPHSYPLFSPIAQNHYQVTSQVLRQNVAKRPKPEWQPLGPSK